LDEIEIRHLGRHAVTVFGAHLEVASVFLVEVTQHATCEVCAEAQAPEHRRASHQQALAAKVMVCEEVGA